MNQSCLAYSTCISISFIKKPHLIHSIVQFKRGIVLCHNVIILNNNRPCSASKTIIQDQYLQPNIRIFDTSTKSSYHYIYSFRSLNIETINQMWVCLVYFWHIEAHNNWGISTINWDTHSDCMTGEVPLQHPRIKLREDPRELKIGIH